MKISNLKLFFIITFSIIIAPNTVYAISFYDPSTTLGLGSADLQETVINIISWVLSMLGMIAVIMILWSGFKWMLSGGNEEKVDSAKKTLSSAIIGLVIVMLSWALVSFVTNNLMNFTGM